MLVEPATNRENQALDFMDSIVGQRIYLIWRKMRLASPATVEDELKSN
jgi:hypothetical protein